MQMFNKLKARTVQHFLEGVDDTPHGDGELQILHQTLHFSHQKAKNSVANTLYLLISGVCKWSSDVISKLRK